MHRKADVGWTRKKTFSTQVAQIVEVVKCKCFISALKHNNSICAVLHFKITLKPLFGIFRSNRVDKDY